MTVRKRLFSIACAAAVLCLSAGVARGQCTGTNPFTCTSTGSTITLTDNDSVAQPQAAVNGYPSAITVPGTVTGTVSNITVRLNTLTASATGQMGQDVGVSSLGILLVHKTTGKNLEILSAPGDATVTFSSVTFNIDDSAAAGYMPTNGDNCPPAEGVPFPVQTTYTYRPSSFETSNALETYAGATALPINRSGPCFATTLNTLNQIFDGVTAAGEWDLYVNNDIGFAEVSIASWSLILTTASAASSTTTLTSSINPSFTGGTSSSTTLTATVTSSGTVDAGTVNFTDGGTTIGSCGAVAVSSGAATCTTTFTTQGFHPLSAGYSGTGSFSPSSGTLNQFVEFHPIVSGNQFCNTNTDGGGAITIPVNNASGTDTQPYPSVMSVSGYTAGTSVSTVQLVLNNTVSFSETVDISMLLVSPDGKALDFFDFVGGGVATSESTITFSDAGVPGPNGSGGLTSPDYQPTSYRSSTSVPPPSFLNPPAPGPQVPGSFFVAAPGGGTNSKTFLEAFNGATANGPWSLYVYDHGDGNTTSIGGWCLTLTPAAGSATVTTVSGSPNGPTPNGAATGATVTVTAVVKSAGVGVTKGSVTFTENGGPVVGASPSGAVNVATSGPTQGQASFTTSSLPQGDHSILATYTDSSNTFNESFGSYVQRVDNTPNVTVNGAAVSYCNAGAVTFPDGTLGPASPNPSNMYVSNLFGTINAVTVGLNGYHESPSADFLDSVLVGPAATKAASLDFFSAVGGSSGDGPFNLIIADSGSNLVPASAFAAGTYKPTSYNTTDTYTASISGFYTLPATYNYASTSGTSTFANVYQNGIPDGNWDLYFNVTGDSGGGALNTGWCLNFTENLVTGAGTTSHIGPAPGNDMVQGGTGSVTLSLLNNGDSNEKGSTGDPDQTVPHAMTVTGTLPSGLTFGTLPSGSPWNCSAIAQALTCTSMVAIAAGSTYPLLTLPVNVASNAPATVTVSGFTFSGAGMTTGTFSSNTITINPTPVLSITKAPSGTFTQGSTAIWDITVSNAAAATSSTSGTVTVVDTLPTGYTLNTNTGTGWACGAVTVTVTCTSTTAVSGGTSYPVIGLTVNVPANSPTSVTNNAVTFGGGDTTHTNSSNGATTFSTVTVVQVPATINLTAGNNQSVAIGTAFAPLTVTVLDGGGVAINGATVTFTAPGTGASGTFLGGTNVKTATTNSSGQATATTYTANLTAGGPYNIGVAAGPATNNFSETNLHGAASSMTANAGTTPQSATISTAFANALAVTVKDTGNNAVPGVSVTFTAPGTGASGIFSNSTATITVMTNASGVASAPFTANATSGGPYTVTAAASGLTTVDFSLTNTVGTPSSMTANAGTTPQSAAINTAFANALAVTVKDSGSNPVSGVSVTFTAPATGASGIFSTSTRTITVATNASGVASAPFTANGTSGGPYSVTATATGLTTVNFSLTNTAGTPSSMTANAGTTPQSATINTPFGNALAVTVKDAGSNPVAGVNVTFTAPASGASGTFSTLTNTITVATNASGVASAPFTANSTAGGPYTVTAAATGLTTVNFSLTNTVGAPSSMTANAGTTPQSAAINTAFANALAVTVKDSGSNPVSGVSVTFTAPATGASGIFSNSTRIFTVATNASGVASAPFTANATSGGPYTVTATATGLTTVNFSLTNTAGTPSSMTANAGTTPQSATIGTAFANALAVTVKDAGSNPVSGVNVTFTAPASGASGTFSNSTNTIVVATNASGVASAPFTANSTAGGPYTVTAAATGLANVNFSLTNTVGAPSSMTANAGTTPQSAAINTAFANALAVTVKDVGSNPLSGVNVTFTAPATGVSGTFSNSTNTIVVVTNASGVASAPFTANGTAGGPYTVTAASTGLTNVNFSLTNTGGGPVITLNPTNQTVPAFQTATFTAAATGTPSPTVQWQVSTDGVNFNPISGANSTTLSFTANGSMNGNFYRAVFTNSINSVPTTAATLTVTKLAPVITWSNPADILYGGALGSAQLNATANVTGTFVYTPPAGTVLPLGPGQTLSVVLTPTDTADYTTASKSVTINVDPISGGGSPANPIVTYVLTRDPSSQNVIATITIANSGGTDATNVQITGATIGGISATNSLPIGVGTVPASGQTTITVQFPSTVGTTGTRAVLSIAGTYTGGTFGSNGRVVLP